MNQPQNSPNLQTTIPAIPQAKMQDDSSEISSNYLLEAAVLRQGVPEALTMARNMIQSPLQEEVLPLFGLMTEYEEEGNFAMWFDTLLWVGECATELGLDSNLPTEFWQQLDFVADRLSYLECLPYIAGKTKGRPERLLIS